MSPDIGRFMEKPKCPSCGSVIVWGVTTMLDEKTDSEICSICKAVVAKK